MQPRLADSPAAPWRHLRSGDDERVDRAARGNDIISHQTSQLCFTVRAAQSHQTSQLCFTVRAAQSGCVAVKTRALCSDPRARARARALFCLKRTER
eukprot:7379333-Prymnesium_polylepis.1